MRTICASLIPPFVFPSRFLPLFAAALGLLCLTGQSAWSQQSLTPKRVQPRTLNQRLDVRWTDDTHFTFTKQLPGGGRQVIVVNAETGESNPQEAASVRNQKNEFIGGPIARSESSPSEINIMIENQSDSTVELFWVDLSGGTRSYGVLEPGKKRRQHTFSGHAWMAKSREGKYFGSMVAEQSDRPFVIRQEYPNLKQRPSQPSPRRGRPEQRPAPTVESRLQGNALQVRDRATDQAWQNLSVDRDSQQRLTRAALSPDGSVLIAWLQTQHRPQDVVTIESSPARGGRAVEHRASYRLPGDPYDEYRLVAFDTKTGQALEHQLPVLDFGGPRVHWFNGNQLAVSKIDRGHQRFRLFRLDLLSSKQDVLIDEQTDTFIWTMHGPLVPLLTYLKDSDRVIYSSEVSGYRHLYMVDLNKTDDWQAHPITRGNWLVRQIIDIDEPAGTLDLMAGGYYPNQDPYFKHLVRVQLDGSESIPVTDGDGDHQVAFSPDKRFVIDSYSRIDLPPVHELRRTKDGQLVCPLVSAERLADGESDFAKPRVFHCVGRDKQTEIWGTLHFPADFDQKAKAKYPIIEAIYAGPHGSHVPKRYSNSARFTDLTDLGFVVVQIDGMGTANRSKAFHDVCWQNLKDAGFPDRIAWIQAAAKVYPALDVDRVGIYGTSAGGQNACGAVLFHGGFYKAAYASCGCHDNRMDKASWNEQWMGYPVGPHYAESSNIDNAAKLSGKLFLVVGELDKNVPPESTYRLVDALIQADKDFEFLMIPGLGHSDGGRYGKRRMREFFVKHLTP